MEESNGYPDAELRGRKTYLKQYVEGLSGKPAWLPSSGKANLVAAGVPVAPRRQRVARRLQWKSS